MDGKKPINAANYEEVKNFLTEARQYLLTLKLKATNELVILSNRRTGFIGFIVCIASLQHLYAKLIQGEGCTPVLKFLPMYKCSQDHLEVMFGIIRFRGGWNNNPTARHFMSAYKKILVQHKLRDSQKGNCTELDYVPILTVPSTLTPVECINLTTNRKCLLSAECGYNDTNDHDYIPSSDSLSHVSVCVAVYIAGFVVKYLEEKIKCEICVTALRGGGTHPSFSLIQKKSRGALIMPADDVVEVCITAEQVFRYSNKGGKYICPKNTIDVLVNEVLSMCINKPLFLNLSTHMKDQLPLDNHLVLLLKAIARRYLQSRMAHGVRMQNDFAHKNKIRSQYTKLIIFQGQ